MRATLGEPSLMHIENKEEDINNIYLSLHKCCLFSLNKKRIKPSIMVLYQLEGPVTSAPGEI